MSEGLKLLDVQDAAIWRGGRCLMSELSFSLGSGQMALIVGPNGSGKTTLLRVLAGLAPCASGAITWNAQPIDRLLPEQRVDLAYRGHLDGLKKDLSIRENLDFYAALRQSGDGPAGLLEELRLTSLADRQVRFLSAGQRRRAALAALRVAQARLWILDEPMTNLDADGRSLVARWLEEHLHASGVAVVATHQPDELQDAGSVLVEL